jgi:peptide/nickel transport system substrate-binding protein
MRRSKPLAAVAGAALLTLAACGGSGGGSSSNSSATDTFQQETGVGKDATRQGPAPEVPGATTGGTITVYLPSDPGPNDLDPTGGWSVTGNSIQQDLTSRSLTTFAYDPQTKDMVLVPDLATDLGTPNADFTSWKFTLKDGLKWEDGSPITAEQVAWGIQRSMDSTLFPSGPGTEYSQTYFSGAGTYKGPYTDKGTAWDGVAVSGNDITIKMAKPFPDMDYWGSFMAMGAVPLGNASKPPAYGLKPLSNGPYKVESFTPTEQLTLVKNDQWDAASDPARHQYADKYIFKFNADPEQTDQTMLSGNAASETSISNAVQATNYSDAKTKLGDRLVQQSAQCTSFWDPDYSKIKELDVRKALAYAYPYEDVWLAGGDIPGVTRIPANSIMPPGMAGKPDASFQVDGAQITYNPDKAKELLKGAGYGDAPYPISMVYYEPDPLAVDAQKQITKALDGAGFKVTAIPVQVSPYDIWLDPTNKINKTLNLRGVRWCADWPSGLTMVPPLTKTGATYNTAHFSEPAIDDEMNNITSNVALADQPAAWGALDKKILTDYYPIIPTAYSNELFAFGSKIGNPTGDGDIAAINYKDLFVMK